MVFEEKRIMLRDGRSAALRSPCEDDAQELLDFIKTASGETEFLARYPEEWRMTAEQEKAWVRSVRSDANRLAIVCCVNGRIAGNCEIDFGATIKSAHRATVMLAILREYWSIGIGTAMFEEMIAAAKKRGTELLDLIFVEGNERARRLYEHFGFRVVAEIPNMYRLKDGTYRSEIAMQLDLRI